MTNGPGKKTGNAPKIIPLMTVDGPMQTISRGVSPKSCIGWILSGEGSGLEHASR
jgi:hypothetical protein